MASSATLFFLLPRSDAATDIVQDPANARRMFKIKVRNEDKSVLGIGQFLSKFGDSSTLAVLGRNGDIIMRPPYISRFHCTFEVNQETQIIMFTDRSLLRNCEVMGARSFPFSTAPTNTRRVALTRSINTTIGIGGPEHNLIKFDLIWMSSGVDDVTQKTLSMRAHSSMEQEPLLERTNEGIETAQLTALPSGFRTPSPTTGQGSARFWPLGAELGAGTFGSVQKGFNVDTGNLLAIKSIQLPMVGSTSRAKRLQYVDREIHSHSKITHPHIVQFLGHQYVGDPVHTVFIALGLEQGTLRQFVHYAGRAQSNQAVSECVNLQILQALDFLAANGIIHRDVKPANILLSMFDDQLHFRLSDLGLVVKHDASETINAGTPHYVAPEFKDPKRQSPKGDVWSLYVTLLWVLDHNGFRGALSSCTSELMAQELVFRTDTGFTGLSEMGRIDPEQRASAAQMLVKLFSGQGLTTPIEDVPPLLEDKALAKDKGKGKAVVAEAGPTPSPDRGGPSRNPNQAAYAEFPGQSYLPSPGPVAGPTPGPSHLPSPGPTPGPSRPQNGLQRRRDTLDQRRGKRLAARAGGANNPNANRVQKQKKKTPKRQASLPSSNAMQIDSQ